MTEGRRETLPHAVEVAVRVCCPVTVPVGVVVPVKVPFGVPVSVRERAELGVSALHRVGEGDVDCVLDCTELRVGLVLVFRERDAAGEKVPDLEDVIVRVAVPEAV